MPSAPVAEGERIESLDVLRGFALLGILLLNIIAFGLPSAAYSNPIIGIAGAADVWTWAAIELFAEGAMRCLFSILFGAGVVLFAGGERGRGAGLHYKRNFWLLAFGLFDAYVLLWSGDILINYALAGAVLYLVRDVSASRLLVTALVLIGMMSLMYAATQFGMGMAKDAAAVVAASEDPDTLSAETISGAEQWHSFAGDFLQTPEQIAAELQQRRDSYWSAFGWNAEDTTDMLLFVLPVILFWDALAMMLLGMALYKYGILQGDRTPGFYAKLAAGGLLLGLAVNASEVYRAIVDDFALLSTFAQAQFTYHIGRLGMAMGYLGLIMLIMHKGLWSSLRHRLACVGRMALTNYLMHSLICLFLFTGAGLAWVGEFMRWQLYGIVVVIWLLQLLFSPWWLRRYRFGPLEWLWRAVTYGKLAANRRV